jgi:hypothetical protein
VTILMRRAQLFSETTLELLVATGVGDVIFYPSLLHGPMTLRPPIATMSHDYCSDGLN